MIEGQQTTFGESSADKTQRSLRLRLLVASFALILICAGVLGYWPRHRTEREVQAAARAEAQALPLVPAVTVHSSPPVSEMVLPGSMTAAVEAYIYARANGYLKRRYADVGDRVAAGQLLAVIDAPDLDQQVTQARATLGQLGAQCERAQAMVEQSRARLKLTQVTWNRYGVLVARGAVSREDADIQFSNYQAALADLAAAEKNVTASRQAAAANEASLQRLITLQAYERVKAPFAGVITARSVDVGALISAAGAGNGPLERTGPTDSAGGGAMFRVAQIDRLRILVSVPQSRAQEVRAGQNATLIVSEYPQNTFAGRVTRTTESLDPSARTLLVEVQVDNPQGMLLPGMYGQVRFVTTRVAPPLVVPGSALVILANGPRLALLTSLTAADRQTLQAQDSKADLTKVRKVRFQTVAPGRDYGDRIEIVKGLEQGQMVASNPNDAVQEGAFVLPTNGDGPAASTSKGK